MSRLALAVALLACQPQVCEVGASAEMASPQDRKLLGVAVDYPADLSLHAHHAELLTSQRLRRAAAWEAVARVLRPVALTEGEETVPLFRTFYDREDTARIFQHLYASLSPEERAARERLDPQLVDDAFLWNVGFADEMGIWPEDRWNDYVASFDDPTRVSSIGGIRRLTLSPSAARHVIESYPDVLGCLEREAPSANMAIEPSTDRLLRTLVRARGCGELRYGPFIVGRDGAIDATLDAGAIVELADETGVRCSGMSRCNVEGPGVFYAIVRADRALEAVLEITRTEAATPIACLDGSFPIDSVSIAAEWRRADGFVLPAYDTSAGALEAMASDPFPTWQARGDVDPSADAIYTQRTASGATYRLAGFHLRTRELPSWLNVTVWWSDDPDSDFGADRPESIRALGAPWSNYKMCVTIDYTEHDADPTGGADQESLAAALAAVHEGAGNPSWCSNPYIDAAPGLARGNCVGCHQHAMSGVEPGLVATDLERFPFNGRTQLRNNYPADGFWGLDAGDELALLLQEVVDYWDE